jgi:hypothetical protein
LKVASAQSASLKLKAKTLALLTFFALGSAFETSSKRSLMSAKVWSGIGSYEDFNVAEFAW